MEQVIYSQTLDILSELDGHALSVKTTFYLTDAVDSKAMTHAIEQFHHRFPYHAVKCIKREPNLVLIDNPEPFVLLEGDVLPVLGTAQTNYHHFAFTYSQKRFTILADHCIADAYVCARISKAVLYFYFKEKYQPDIRIDFYHKDPEDIPPSVYQNIFENIEPENVPVPFDRNMPLGRYDICQRMDRSAPAAYRVRISYSKYRQYAVSYGIGPGAFLALLVNRALAKIHPDTQELKALFCVNPRDVLGFPDALNSNVYIFFLGFYDSIKKLSLSEQMHAYAKLAEELNCRENIEKWARAHRYMYDQFKGVSTFKEGIEKFRKAPVEYKMLPASFCISYINKKIQFTEICEDRIETISLCSAPLVPITFEAIHFRGGIHITFQQSFGSDAYFRAFLSELENIGIEYQQMETIDGRVSHTYYPVNE